MSLYNVVVDTKTEIYKYVCLASAVNILLPGVSLALDSAPSTIKEVAVFTTASLSLLLAAYSGYKYDKRLSLTKVTLKNKLSA